MFDLMLRPFVECLILVGIHSYLGLHVIRRRVIFVDLALAQIAALGTIVGGVLGLMGGTGASLFYSLTFCLAGAALFAFTRVRHDRIPHEAVIGLVYIVSFALAVLIVQKTEGVEHMEGILVGSLLYVRWSDIIAAGSVYAMIGLFHLVFWRKFLLISDYPEKAYRQGINIRLWDFLFYASFGFVITFSTHVAGVLLVFVFLVAPAIMAVMITTDFKKQLLIGWSAGTVVIVVGLYLSVVMDMPPGPMVVAFYAVVLAALAVVVYFVRAENRTMAVVHALFGTLVVGVVGMGIFLEGKLLAGMGEGHDMHAGRVAASSKAHAAAAGAAGQVSAAGAGPAAGATVDLTVLEKATGGCVGPGKLQRYAGIPDYLEKIAFIQRKARESKRKALGFVLILLADPDASGFYRTEATELLRQLADTDFGYDPDKTPADNATAIDKICCYLRAVKQTRGPRAQNRPDGKPVTQ